MDFDGEIVSTSVLGPRLDTVRALHQTIVALRAALERSKSEINELKAHHTNISRRITAAALVEDHQDNNNVLRVKKILPVSLSSLESVKCNVDDDKNNNDKELLINNNDAANIIISDNDIKSNDNKCAQRENDDDLLKDNQSSKICPSAKKVLLSSSSSLRLNNKFNKLQTKLEAKILIKTKSLPCRNHRHQKQFHSTSLESLTTTIDVKTTTGNNKPTDHDDGDDDDHHQTLLTGSLPKTFTFSNLSNLIINKEVRFNNNNNNISLNEPSETEVIINTTMMNDDTRHEEPENNDMDQDQEVDDIELIFTTDETKDSDFKEQLVSIDAPAAPGDQFTSPQSHHLDEENLSVDSRELDDDVFNDNFTTNSQHHPHQDNFQSCEFKSSRDSSHHQMYNSKSDNSLNHEERSLKSCYSYQDSSFENKSLEKDESFDRFEERIRIVETDISKCGIQDVEYVASRRNTCPNPLQYRPLLHREALFKGRKARPILAHSNAIRKDSGAQTDISALPSGSSAWLSESNLANKVRLGENFPTLPSKFPHPGSRLRLSEKTVESRRVLLSDIGFTSMVPELSRSADHLCPANNAKPPVATTYGQFLKTSDFNSPAYTSQRFTYWTTATPSECSYSQSRYNSMYPLPSPPPPTHSRRCSAPVSPSRRTILKSAAASKVRFANGSLPELRGDWTVTIDSGDSTDSLVDEAENYLRRSIDCIMSSRDRSDQIGKKSLYRRASAPEPAGDNVLPQGWQPFLPRVARDLKPDHWVKVITAEGRVKGGRVRYVGPVVLQTEQFVGVQLGTAEGHSDGTYSNRRYFQCEPYHGIFVPFKKVIMGWKP